MFSYTQVADGVHDRTSKASRAAWNAPESIKELPNAGIFSWCRYGEDRRDGERSEPLSSITGLRARSAVKDGSVTIRNFCDFSRSSSGM